MHPGVPGAEGALRRSQKTPSGSSRPKLVLAEVELISISSKTAFKCLHRVSTGTGTATRSDGRAYDPLDNDALSIDQLIDIARQRGLKAKLKHLEWRELQVAASTDAVLLVLRNGNMVTVIRNGSNEVQEIVVSDPLYQDGEEFLLPREALEPAWDGDTVILRRHSVSAKYKVGFFVFGLGFCAVTAVVGGLIFYSDNPAVLATNAPKSSVIEPGKGTTNSAMSTSDKTTILSMDASSALTEEAHPDIAKLPPMAKLEVDGTEAPLAPDSEKREVLSRSTSKPEAVNTLVGSDLDVGTRPPATADVSAAPLFNAATVSGTIPPAATAEFASNAEREELHAESVSGALKELPPSRGAARTAASAERPRLTTAEIDSLIARGDALLNRGDFISARLYYERAADAGEGQAALRMGESYDPAFLARSRVAGFRGDALLAARWYLRALELGTPGAEILFKAVAADNGSSAR
jgi:hypothetical protein